MNKKEWIKAVAKETAQPEALVETILDAGLEEIYQSMKREEKVTLQNFGTFYIDVRRSGTSTHPRSGRRSLAGRHAIAESYEK